MILASTSSAEWGEMKENNEMRRQECELARGRAVEG